MSYAAIIKELKRQDTIVSMPYREWLLTKSDEGLPQWVVDRIMAQMVQRPRIRVGSFSPSSSGQCLRRQELSFLGVPVPFGAGPDARLMNIFNDGKWRHLRWQANLLAAGILTDIEWAVPWIRMRALGNVDGRGYVREDHPRMSWRGKEFGFELKGANPFMYNKQTRRDEPDEKHLRQVHRYFLQGGFELYVILYEEKGTNEWKEWVVEPDPVILEEAREELIQLNASIDSGRLHPMLPSCKIRMGDQWTRECPYAGETGICVNTGSRIAP